MALVALAVGVEARAPVDASQACDEGGREGGFRAGVYSSQVSWKGSTGARVEAELYDQAGRQGHATGYGGSDGWASLDFEAADGSPALIEPGMWIRMIPEGKTAFTETVPIMAAAVDTQAGAIRARLPEGASVCLYLGLGAAARLQGGYTASQDGLMSAIVSFLDSDTVGFVSLRTARGNQFQSRFATFTAGIPTGGTVLEGRASAGTQLHVTVATPDGDRKESSESVTAEQRWRKVLTPSLRVRPGTRITVTRFSPVWPDGTTVSAEVPLLTANVAPGGRVYGDAPALSSVMVAVRPPGGQEEVFYLTADDEGHYQLTLSDATQFGPGWQISARLKVRPWATVSTTVSYYPIDITLHTGLVSGVIDSPGSTVNIVLEDAEGRVKAAGSTDAFAEGVPRRTPGGFGFRFAEARIEPGDVLNLDWHDGDPLRLAVPMFSARADARSNNVLGSGPPGAVVDVGVWEGSRDGPPRLVDVQRDTIDPSGGFRTSFDGQRELARGTWGEASIRGMAGSRFIVLWSTVFLEWHSVTGLRGRGGVAGQLLEVTLRDAQGEAVGQYQEDLEDPGSNGWSADVRSTAGEAVHAQAGDVFEVSVGGVSESLALPPLDGVVHVDQDRIAGYTTPNSSVSATITSERGVYAKETIQADAHGLFMHDFSGVMDIRHNDMVILRRTVHDLHRVTRSTTTPGMTVQLDTAHVRGAHSPGKHVAATVLRDADAIGHMRGMTDHVGNYALTLTGPDGQLPDITQGDRVIVETQDVDAHPVLSMRIPELKYDLQREGQRIVGSASPGGRLSFLVDLTFRRMFGGGGAVSMAQVVIDDDGRFVEDFSGSRTRPDFRPGQVFEATYRQPSGHEVVRSRVMPIVNVEHGAARVCGFATPGEDVEVTVSRGGSEVGLGKGEADPSGRFAFVLRDEQREALEVLAGDEIHAVFEHDETQFEIPAMSIIPRWEVARYRQSGYQTVLDLSIPPGRDYYLSYPAEDCFAGADVTVDMIGNHSGRGTNEWRLPDEIAPGTPIQVALYTDEGHRYFKQVRRTRLEAFLRSDRIDGVTTAGANVKIDVMDIAGTLKGVAEVVAGAGGRFSTRLRGGDGQSTTLLPGDELVITTKRRDVEAAGAVKDEVVLEDLTFDFGRGSGLEGRTQAGRSVEVIFGLVGGQVLEFTRAVDDDGRFAYGRADLPVRSAWTLDDVEFVRAATAVGDGHAVVVDTRQTLESGGFVEDVYLPVCVR